LISLKKSSLKGLLTFWGEFKRQQMPTLCLGVILFILFIAIVAPFISPYDPYYMSEDLLSPPNFRHPFGTDQYGRDILSRAIWGTRIAIIVAVGSAGLSALIGIFLGSIAGYYGGLLDDLLTRLIDFFLIIPTFFLMVLIVALFGSNISFVILIIGLTSWPSNARIMRAQVLSLKERPYIDAAKVAGVNTFRILFSHIIPNGAYPVIANSTLQMANAILIEGGLAFLGLEDPHIVSWGNMIQAARAYLVIAWWAIFFPGVAMLIMVFALNMIGNGISVVFNPSLRR